MTALVGEGQEIFVAAIFTFHAGKAVVLITAMNVAELPVYSPQTCLMFLSNAEILE